MLHVEGDITQRPELLRLRVRRLWSTRAQPATEAGDSARQRLAEIHRAAARPVFEHVALAERRGLAAPALFVAEAHLVALRVGEQRELHADTPTFALTDAWGKRDTGKALGNLAFIFAFMAVFWSLWDQSGGRWVLQATKMDLHFAGITWLPSQIQAVNAIGSGDISFAIPASDPFCVDGACTINHKTAESAAKCGKG